MCIPSPLRDHLFVQVDTAALDRTPSGLYIPDWQPGDKDAQQAIVVAAPKNLSGNPLGFPNMDGRAYTHRDLQKLPHIGDTVYLKPNTFRAEAEFPGHPGVFLVPLDKVIAYRHISLGLADVVQPFQGLLLCEPVYHDDVRMGDKGVRERIEYNTQAGIVDEATMRDQVTTLLIKEVDPAPIPFVLKVVWAGVPLQGQPDLVKAGDVVAAHKMLFAYHAVKQKDNEEASGRWIWQPSTIIIDGHEYCYIPRQCVMAKLDSTELKFQVRGVNGNMLTTTAARIKELASGIVVTGNASGTYDAGPQSIRFTDEWGQLQNTDGKAKD